MDVGEDSSGGDGDSAQKLVELLVVLNGKSDVPGDDPGLLVVPGSVSGELEDLSAQVLHDSSEVHGGTAANTGSIASFTQIAGHAADGELKTSARAARLGFASFTATCAFAFALALIPI